MSDTDPPELPVLRATPVAMFLVKMAGVAVAVVARVARGQFLRCRLARVGEQVTVGQELRPRSLDRRSRMAAAVVVVQETTKRIRAFRPARRLQQLQELVALVVVAQVVNARMRLPRELRTPEVVAVVVDTHMDSVVVTKTPLVVAVAQESSSFAMHCQRCRHRILTQLRTMVRPAATTSRRIRP